VITEQQLMDIAYIVGRSSHCVSLKVGALIVKDFRIISMGYNGTPSGYTNCDELWEGTCTEHSIWSHDNEIHAEMNAIAYAAKAGLTTDGCDMYTTTSPCRQCLKHMAPVGIKTIYFDSLYRATTEEQHFQDKLYCESLGMSLVSMRDFE